MLLSTHGLNGPYIDLDTNTFVKDAYSDNLPDQNMPKLLFSMKTIYAEDIPSPFLVPVRLLGESFPHADNPKKYNNIHKKQWLTSIVDTDASIPEARKEGYDIMRYWEKHDAGPAILSVECPTVPPPYPGGYITHFAFHLREFDSEYGFYQKNPDGSQLFKALKEWMRSLSQLGQCLWVFSLCMEKERFESIVINLLTKALKDAHHDQWVIGRYGTIEDRNESRDLIDIIKAWRGQSSITEQEKDIGRQQRIANLFSHPQLRERSWIAYSGHKSS